DAVSSAADTEGDRLVTGMGQGGDDLVGVTGAQYQSGSAPLHVVVADSSVGAVARFHGAFTQDLGDAVVVDAVAACGLHRGGAHRPGPGAGGGTFALHRLSQCGGDLTPEGLEGAGVIAAPEGGRHNTRQAQ